MIAENKDIHQLQDNIINKALVVFSLFSLVLHIFAFIYRFKVGFDIPFFLNSFILLCLYSITIFRKKLSFDLKIFLFLITQLMGLCLGVYYNGVFSTSVIFMVVSPIFLSFLVSYRKSLLFLSFSILILLIFAFLYVKGILQYNSNVYTSMRDITIWFVYIVVVTFTSWGLLYVSVYFRESLADSFNLISTQNKGLSDQEKKYRTLFEDAGDAILLLDGTGDFFDANQIACDYFKISKSNIIGKSAIYFSPEYQLDQEESIVKAKKLIDLAISGETQRFEWLHQDTTGKNFIVSVSLRKIELLEGVYFQAILRDITEAKQIEQELKNHRLNLEVLVKQRTEELATAMKELQVANEELQATNEELFDKNAIINQKNDELTITLNNLKETQQQLVQAEKMASLGTLTAGVAHEINNPLNYLMGAQVGLENYFNEYGTFDKSQTDILQESILVGVERISNIVNGLNQFSRSNEKLDEDCDVHSILNNCLIILQNKLKHKAEILKEYSEVQILIRGNVGKLHQAFFNILANSIQAIPQQGFITIKTKIQQYKTTVEITDNGIGIKAEHIGQITDPFFTTKPPGEGTGLGLSITYSIIKEHRGTMDFESEIGKGTKVIVTLPLKPEQHES